MSDYSDPGLPDLSCQLTEVERFPLTPGGTFTATTNFRDVFGDVRIVARFHLTEVDGETVVERSTDQVPGCPWARGACLHGGTRFRDMTADQ